MFLYKDDDGESFEKMIREYIKKKEYIEYGEVNIFGRTGIISEDIAFYQEDFNDVKEDSATYYEEDIEGLNKYLEEKYKDNNLYYSVPNSYDIDEIEYLNNDMDYMKGIAGRKFEIIYPFIIEVLNEYEFEGCPMFIETMDNSFIDTVVMRIIKKASLKIREIAEILYEEEISNWSRRHILWDFVKISVLNELFGSRRPKYRRILKNEFVR